MKERRSKTDRRKKDRRGGVDQRRIDGGTAPNGEDRRKIKDRRVGERRSSTDRRQKAESTEES